MTVGIGERYTRNPRDRVQIGDEKFGSLSPQLTSGLARGPGERQICPATKHKILSVWRWWQALELSPNLDRSPSVAIWTIDRDHPGDLEIDLAVLMQVEHEFQHFLGACLHDDRCLGGDGHALTVAGLGAIEMRGPSSAKGSDRRERGWRA